MDEVAGNLDQENDETAHDDARDNADYAAPHVDYPSLARRARVLGLCELAAGGDGPDGFDLFAAAGVNPVVEVHTGVAVRDDELEPLAQCRQLAARLAR